MATHVSNPRPRTTGPSFRGGRCGLLALGILAAGAATVGAQGGPIENVNDGHALQRECGAALNAAAERQANPDGLDTDAGFDAGQCLGLVSGVWHTHMLMVDELDAELAFCPSRAVGTGQMAGVVDRYLEGHPGELAEWDTVLIMRAFVEAYPCRRR